MRRDGLQKLRDYFSEVRKSMSFKAYRLGLPYGGDDVSSMQLELMHLEEENARHTIRHRKQLQRQIAHVTESGNVGIDTLSTPEKPGRGVATDVACTDYLSRHLPSQPTVAGIRQLRDVATCHCLNKEHEGDDTRATSSHNDEEPTTDCDVCPNCELELKVCTAKGVMVCEQCGMSRAYMDVTVNALPYNNNVDVSGFSYKRINHFNDLLLQVQAKEAMCVPEEVCQSVRDQLAKQRVRQVTATKVREILKGLKLNKMYDHITQIICRVTGQDATRLTPEEEQKCRLMFIAIQGPFEMHCPSDRKNFLSYPYCLYKFLQLLGCTHVLGSFNLLKSKDKLYLQDLIFKRICETLNWEFIPSV